MKNKVLKCGCTEEAHDAFMCCPSDDICIRCGAKRRFHPCKEFVSGEREFDLEFCSHCVQTTTHVAGTCMKCYDPYTCPWCGRKMSPWINPETGKMEKYSWYCYKCQPKFVLSIG